MKIHLKRSTRAIGIALAAVIVSLGLLNSLSAKAENGQNRPPAVDPIRGVLNPPTTHYTIRASDPDGDALTYAWSGDISCGKFREDSKTNSAFWDHPDGKSPWCPHNQGTSHPGTIRVSVSDGTSVVVCEYEGSESGAGETCLVQNASSSGAASSGGLLWGVVLIALAGGGYAALRILRGKPRVCADEYVAEGAARVRKARAARAFDDIDRARKEAQASQDAAKKAQADADHAQHEAGTRWSASGSTDWEGEHLELHREGWHDKAKDEIADQAAHRAREAAEKAAKAKESYDASGGESAWNRARDEKQKSEDAWRKAKEALDRCLNAASAPAPTPVPTPMPVPTPPAPPQPPVGPTGPVVPAPVPTPTTPSRVCIDGERRQARTATETVTLLDLQSIRLMQDRIYSDAGNEAMKFMDWLQTIKDTFMLGKKIKGGIEGYLTGSVTGAADAAGLPDFLTWYDEATDALVKSMNQLAQIMREKQQLGTYWLEYSTKQLTLTCARYDLCVNGAWVQRCELSVTPGANRTTRTGGLEVLDIRELNPVIRRLFDQLRNRYRPEKDKAKRFSSSCV